MSLLVGEDRAFWLILAWVCGAYIVLVPVVYVVAPDYHPPDVWGYAAGPGPLQLGREAPSAEPATRVAWEWDGWLGDTVHVRATAPLAGDTAVELDGLYGDATALFPDWVG